MTVAFDSASKGATTVIAGLHVSATSNINNGARADLSLSSGKFWFEFVNNFVSLATDSGTGVTPAASPNYTNLAANAAGGLMIYRSGTIWLNGVNTGRSVTSGIRFSPVIFAIDFGANLLWAKAAGNAFWLDDITANPVTGVLGIDISSITAGGLYPVGVITSLANSFDGEFGAGVPVNTPPSGYSSWATTPPAVATRHAIYNARMQGFANNATAISQRAGASLTLAATEGRDTCTMSIEPTVGMTFSVTEGADTCSLVPPDSYNVGGLTTPRVLADEDVIYVLENNETIYVEGDFSSSFVIPSEDTMQAT